MSHHKVAGDFKPTKRNLATFLSEIKEWFANLAKGREVIITPYDEKASTVILIKHGSYVRTLPYWKDNEVHYLSFRPANEDILFYDKKKNVLAIKARLPKERDQYLASFARCIIGDESILTSADRDKIYSLEPVQNGTFNWNGNEKVREVVLTKACLKIPGATEATIIISSEDVLKTLREDLPSLSLKSGELVSACFRFTLNIDNANPCVSFLIKPPSVSDLSQKKYQEVINEFLEEQGVKLA
ncbi:MAG: hypothetical protein NTZ78_03445 [Candidatus Aureabacteria bacterium]|nr:hypothetical protein [Candidatus Auribacterota bacterium]